MFRAFFVAISLALGAAPEPGLEPSQAGTPVPDSVLAVFFNEVGPGSELTRVHPLTLKPKGPRLRLATGGGWTTALSPDRRTLAVAGGLGQATVEFVDVRRMRSLGSVDLKMIGSIALLSWRSGLFAVVDDVQERAVVRIDPVGRRVVARHRFDGTILQAQEGMPGQVVLLVAPPDRIGPLRFVVVGGKGMVSTAVPGFVGGWTTERDGDDVLTRQHIPALVIDVLGRRALVVSGRRVAAVSLRNLSVTEHTLSESVSLLERFRNWLEPTAQAKLVEGPAWSGGWVGDAHFAVAGIDYAGTHGVEKPLGIELVDTRDWSTRRLAADTADLVVSGSTVLSYHYDGRSGVRGYDRAGEERFHVLRGAPVLWLQPVAGLVYAHLGNGERVAVIDPVGGRVLGTAKLRKPVALVG